jgi:hypothetical protein
MPEPTKSYGAAIKPALDLSHAIEAALFRSAGRKDTPPVKESLQREPAVAH